MAESFIGNVIEFLIGFLIVPIIIAILIGVAYNILLPDTPKEVQDTSFFTLIVKGIVLILLFSFKKSVAIGFLVSLLIGIIFSEPIINYLYSII